MLVCSEKPNSQEQKRVKCFLIYQQHHGLIPFPNELIASSKPANMQLLSNPLCSSPFSESKHCRCQAVALGAAMEEWKMHRTCYQSILVAFSSAAFSQSQKGVTHNFPLPASVFSLVKWDKISKGESKVHEISSITANIYIRVIYQLLLNSASEKLDILCMGKLTHLFLGFLHLTQCLSLNKDLSLHSLNYQ